MFTLKAFATNAALTNNTPGQVSNIGELSPLSLTFAKDKGIYKSATSADIGITSFTCTLNNTPYTLTQDLVDEAIGIIKHIFNSNMASNNDATKLAMLIDLANIYTGVATGFQSGAIVNQGNIYMPEWISWSSLNTTNIGTGNVFKFWLSDSRFQLEFDDYSITVIPPVNTLDGFFTGATNVANLVSGINIANLMDSVQLAKGGYPETVVRTKLFNYTDPTNPNNLIPTVWNLIIYGNAGDNLLVIQEAISAYILANSTHNQLQWTTIFPDIFKHTEFTIIPEWKKFSISNQVLQAGIYSPIENIASGLSLLHASVNNYPTIHIDAHASVMAQPYKALTLLAIGSPDNKNNKFGIEAMFPDYINIASTNSDFSRMSQDTQNFAIMLELMIITAENMTATSNIPQGMSRTTRNGILYLVSTYQNIDYLVAASISFP